MGLDIHRSLTDEYGEIDEDAAQELEEELMELFADSPEAKPIIERTGDVGWAGVVMEHGRIYEGITITTMGQAQLLRVLLYVFPRKVSCEPSAAPEIVEELRAFWSFLRRELGLQSAEECLAILDEKMAKAMERELADPSNFGMAKSLIMGGMAAGFDMTTKEGIDTFMRAYKANPQAIPIGPSAAFRRPPPTRAEKNKKKARRRAQQKGRRKSR